MTGGICQRDGRLVELALEHLLGRVDFAVHKREKLLAQALNLWRKIEIHLRFPVSPGGFRSRFL